MNRTVISALGTLVLAGLALTGIVRVPASEPRIPYPEALDAAAVSVDRLDSILEHALLVGNGDINALVYSDGGQLKLMLTKNDVWDARLDSKLDPPLPTLALIKKLGPVSPTKYGTSSVILDEGSTWQGPDSYHAHPYPCPRPCARLVLSERPEQPCWKNIRDLGSRTSWETRGTAAVMGLEGPAESSNGYAFGPLNVTSDQYDRLRLKVAGSPNARFFIDVIGPERQPVLSSGWTDSPAEIEERTFSLRPGCRIEQVILYTWTEDGKPAENRFESLVLDGPAGQLAIPLEQVATPTCPGRLDIRRAVASVAGEPGVVPKAEIRALADRNVFLIKSAAASELVPITSADVVTAQPAESDGALCLVQEIPGDLDWPGMSYAVALMHQGDRIAVAIVTSREAADPQAAAIQLARSTLAEDESPLVAGHDRQWAEFWSASGIDMPDTILRDAWYRNLYFLRCVSKPGVIAPGLFASLIDDTPAWHGDYHTNYNIQQTFWPALVTNHADLAEPYDRLIREYLPRARWLARQVFDMDGAYYPHVLFAYEPPDPAQCKSPGGRQYLHHVWGFTLGVAGFSVQPVWWHYKYAPSREFLEQTAYPVVRDVAQFYAEFIEQCEGDSQRGAGAQRLARALGLDREFPAEPRLYVRHRHGPLRARSGHRRSHDAGLRRSLGRTLDAGPAASAALSHDAGRAADRRRRPGRSADQLQHRRAGRARLSRRRGRLVVARSRAEPVCPDDRPTSMERQQLGDHAGRGSGAAQLARHGGLDARRTADAIAAQRHADLEPAGRALQPVRALHRTVRGVDGRVGIAAPERARRDSGLSRLAGRSGRPV